MSDKVKLRVDLSGKEDKSNKITTLSSSSTHQQYPTAKTVYDAITELEIGGGGNYINDYYFDTTTKELVIDYTSDGSGGGSGTGNVDISTSWGTILSDTKVPSEKLAKETIDTKQDTLVSGTNLKTINNTSLLGSGNINITGGNGDTLDVENFYIDTTNDEIVIVSGTGGGSSVTVDSTWVSNSTNPVQSQLIKTALDNKANQTHTHTKSQITDFPRIPTKVSDLQNDSQFITSSNIVDNLNSNSSTTPLSAKQGKELADMIGNILTIINGTGT